MSIIVSGRKYRIYEVDQQPNGLVSIADPESFIKIYDFQSDDPSGEFFEISMFLSQMGYQITTGVTAGIVNQYDVEIHEVAFTFNVAPTEDNIELSLLIDNVVVDDYTLELGNMVETFDTSSTPIVLIAGALLNFEITAVDSMDEAQLLRVILKCKKI